MPMQKDSSSNSMTLGIIFGFVAIVALIGLILINTEADNSSQTASVDNEDPSPDSITISATSQGAGLTDLTLTENATTTFYLYGTFSDANGCRQIENVNGAGDGTASSSKWEVYAGISGNGFDHSADCRGNLGAQPGGQKYTGCYAVDVYQDDVSGCNSDSDTTIDYEFEFPMAYYALATDFGSLPDNDIRSWSFYVRVTDEVPGNNIGTANLTRSVDTLKALNVDASVNYGNLALGASSSAQTLTVTNTGNYDGLSPQISQASDWTCDFGTIDKSKTVYMETDISADATSWASGNFATSATASATTMHGWDANGIGKTTDGLTSTSSQQFYTVLDLESGVVAGGSCTSTLTLTAN